MVINGDQGTISRIDVLIAIFLLTPVLKSVHRLVTFKQSIWQLPKGRQ